MTERIRIKLENIMGHLKILREMKNGCEEKFPKDPVYRGALLHYLYLVSDSSITLAELVIKEKGLRTPQSYSEAIDIMGEAGVIPPEFAYDFAKIASLRNFLAHDYEKLDYLRICREALEKLGDIEKYAGFIKEKL